MTEAFDPANHAHRRYNPLIEEWVLVSPHRNKRPWQGQTEKSAMTETLVYDADCYLCPGNVRMGGASNANYKNTFAFDNDFPALTTDTPHYDSEDPLFKCHAEQGCARVLAYSPDHSKTLAELEIHQITKVIDAWITQSQDLGAQYPWVQIFENKGEVMGCSMPHPHGQIWAQTSAPTIIAKETRAQGQYFADQQSTLLLDYAARELDEGSRVVDCNEDWLTLVPFWASWPFEILLLPRFPVRQITKLTTTQRQSLAEILRHLTVRYDNLFKCSFPYSMGWHGAPFLQTDNDSKFEGWQLHAHFYPPLLRSSIIRKFMVGYEMLAEPQRDLTPEQAADILRAQSLVHYKKEQVIS